jgi:hypothetical protein
MWAVANSGELSESSYIFQLRHCLNNNISLVHRKIPPKITPHTSTLPVLDIPTHPPADVSPRKVKTKRRGTSSAAEQNEPTVQTQPRDVALSVPEIIAVPARAFKTLRMLFRLTSK